MKVLLESVNERVAAKGLRVKETTDEYMDMLWKCCNEFNPNIEGINREELNFIMTFMSKQRPNISAILYKQKVALENCEKEAIRSQEDPRITAERIRLIKLYSRIKILSQEYKLFLDIFEEKLETTQEQEANL